MPPGTVSPGRATGAATAPSRGRGVIDPAKVVRCAIQNAASISALMLTTEAVVAEIPEKKKDTPMPPGGMGGMDDY